MAGEMNRRKILKNAGVATAASVVVAPNVIASPKIKWTLVASWPKGLPGISFGPETIKKAVEKLSGGQITIDIKYAGEMGGPLEVFDLVSSGKADLGHSASYYWAGKHPGLNYFTAVPFGLTAQEFHAWIQYGDAQKLWDEAYAAFNLKGFAAGNTGPQMAGWFNKKITNIGDFKGLKMRIPGLGGKVFERLEGVPVNMGAGQLYAAFKNNEIEAGEFVGPYNDLPLKLHEVAKYYYWPSWQEPASSSELMVNKKIYDGMSAEHKQILAYVCQMTTVDMLSDYTFNNNLSLNKLVTEHKVQIQRLPDPVLAALGKASKEVLNELSSKGDDLTKKIHKSFSEFQKVSIWWNKIGEEGFSAARTLTFG